MAIVPFLMTQLGWVVLQRKQEDKQTIPICNGGGCSPTFFSCLKFDYQILLCSWVLSPSRRDGKSSWGHLCHTQGWAAAGWEVLGCGASHQVTESAIGHRGWESDALQPWFVWNGLGSGKLLWVGSLAAGGITRLAVAMSQHLQAHQCHFWWDVFVKSSHPSQPAPSEKTTISFKQLLKNCKGRTEAGPLCTTPACIWNEGVVIFSLLGSWKPPKPLSHSPS